MYGAPYRQATPYMIPIGISVLPFAVLAAYLFHRRTEHRLVPGATLGALLSIASELWMETYALELSMADSSMKVLLSQLGCVGIVPLSLLWSAYVLCHADVKLNLQAVWVALGSMPIAAIALVMTSPWYGLTWADLWVDAGHGHAALVNEHGAAFDDFIAYAHVLVLLGCGVPGRTLLRAGDIHRKQALALLGGGLVSAVGGVVYVAGLSPVPDLDLPVLTFSVISTAVAWNTFHHRLFTLVPVAWESAVESTYDATLALNGDGRVIDVSPVGERFPLLPLSDTYGQFVVRTPPTELADVLGGVPTTRSETETALMTEDDECAFFVETTPLGDESDMSGSLVLIHNAIEWVEHKRRLERQNEWLDELASVVFRDLRDLLTVVRGYLELVTETGDAEYFKRIKNAHDRMETIVEDLLTLAREGETLTGVIPVAL